MYVYIFFTNIDLQRLKKKKGVVTCYFDLATVFLNSSHHTMFCLFSTLN